jgi:hypothetical protein
MARNGTHSKTIEAHFKENPGRAITIGTLMRVAKCGKGSVSSAISYLNAKARSGKGGIAIDTLTRGHSWAYYPHRQPNAVSLEFDPEPADSNGPPERTTVKLPNVVEGQPVSDREASERLRKLADKITEPLPPWRKVPAGEPEVSFRVIGTLLENGQLVLQGVSAGVQGVWMARRVD